MAFLGKMNMYIMPAVYLFVVSTILYQVIPYKFKKTHAIIYNLPWIMPFAYILIVLTLVFASLNFKVRPVEYDDSGKPKNEVQLKINRVFSVMSGALATYSLTSFFFITYSAVENFWFNVNNIYFDTTMI